MAAHPHINAYAIDLSDVEEKSRDLDIMFERAAEHTPALVILEGLDRAFPTEGKWTTHSEFPKLAELSGWCRHTRRRHRRRNRQ